MQIVSLVSQKGGTGKSTLTCGLAVTAALFGEQVAIIDLDPQGTVASWARTRSSRWPRVRHCPDPDRLQGALNELTTEGVELVFLDTPATDNAASRAAIMRSALCLVPVRPSEADLRATMPTLRTLAALGTRYCVLINQAPAHQGARAEHRAAPMASVLSTVIYARVDHQHAYALSLGVHEFAPRGKAASELSNLWQEVAGRLGRAIPNVSLACPASGDAYEGARPDRCWAGQTPSMPSPPRASRPLAVCPRPSA
jgi:chromosome partitioning protein